jgi:hypothetical protein
MTDLKYDYIDAYVVQCSYTDYSIEKKLLCWHVWVIKKQVVHTCIIMTDTLPLVNINTNARTHMHAWILHECSIRVSAKKELNQYTQIFVRGYVNGSASIISLVCKTVKICLRKLLGNKTHAQGTKTMHNKAEWRMRKTRNVSFGCVTVFACLIAQHVIFKSIVPFCKHPKCQFLCQ